MFLSDILFFLSVLRDTIEILMIRIERNVAQQVVCKSEPDWIMMKEVSDLGLFLISFTTRMGMGSAYAHKLSRELFLQSSSSRINKPLILCAQCDAHQALLH